MRTILTMALLLTGCAQSAPVCYQPDAAAPEPTVRLVAGETLMDVGHAAQYCRDQGGRLLRADDLQLSDGRGAAACPGTCWTSVTVHDNPPCIVSLWMLTSENVMVKVPACTDVEPVAR